MKKWTIGACCLMVIVPSVLWFVIHQDPPAEITIKLLAAPNPTSYIFDRSVDQVDAVLANYRDRRWGCVFMADNPVSADEEKVLPQPGNEHDGYLDACDANSKPSDVYFLPNGKPAEFGAGFHFHVTRIDDAKTKVEVFVHKPWLYIGERKRYVFPLGWHERSIFIKVVPTTVDEYSLLWKLGLAMGVTNMPPVILPTADSGEKKFRFTDSDVINLPHDRDPLDWTVPSTLTQ